MQHVIAFAKGKELMLNARIDKTKFYEKQWFKIVKGTNFIKNEYELIRMKK